MGLDCSVVLQAADEDRQRRGFLTIGEILRLREKGNVIYDPLSLLISSRVVIGGGNKFFPSVLIECNEPGTLVIGDNNAFFSGCHLMADPGVIIIGNANQFGEGGCFIKANRL